MEADPSGAAAVQTAVLAERLFLPDLRTRAVGCALRKVLGSGGINAGLTSLCEVLPREELDSLLARGDLGPWAKFLLATVWGSAHLATPEQHAEREALVAGAVPWGLMAPKELRAALRVLQSSPLLYTPRLVQHVAEAALDKLG